MNFGLPWQAWLFIGIFIGLMMGNKRFRHEVDSVVARIMGRKARPWQEPPKEEAKEKTDKTSTREVGHSQGSTHIHERDIYIK